MLTKPLEHWRKRLLAKPGAQEDNPLNLKPWYIKSAVNCCSDQPGWKSPPYEPEVRPQEALIIRDSFTAVTPGYHMNKKH